MLPFHHLKSCARLCTRIQQGYLTTVHRRNLASPLLCDTKHGTNAICRKYVHTSSSGFKQLKFEEKDDRTTPPLGKNQSGASEFGHFVTDIVNNAKDNKRLSDNMLNILHDLQNKTQQGMEKRTVEKTKQSPKKPVLFEKEMIDLALSTKHKAILEETVENLRIFCDEQKEGRDGIIKSNSFKLLLNYITNCLRDKKVAAYLFDRHLLGNIIQICGNAENFDELNKFKMALDTFTASNNGVFISAYISIFTATYEMQNDSFFCLIHKRCSELVSSYIKGATSAIHLSICMRKILPILSAQHSNFLYLLRRQYMQLMASMNWKSFLQILEQFDSPKFKFDKRFSEHLYSHITEKGQLHYCPSDAARLMVACSNHGIYVPKFLQIVTDTLLSQNTVSNPLPLLKAVDSLRWRHPALQDLLLGKVNRNLLPGIMAATVCTAKLNYCSEEFRSSLLQILPEFDILSERNTHLLVTFVFSLCVLDIWNLEVFEQIFTTEFQKKVENYCKDASPFEAKAINTKLRNIIEYSYHRTKHLPRVLDIPLEAASSKKMNIITGRLIEDVFSRQAQDKFLNMCGSTGRQIPIDCELEVDDLGVLQPYGQTEDKLHRIVLQGLKYFEMSIPNPDPVPLGPSVLYRRLLEHEGYKVVTVPYHEFSQLKNSQQKIDYLHSKVKDVIGATEKQCPSWDHLQPK